MGLRYGSRAFQGVFLGLSDLPLGLQLKGVVGKSNFNKAVYEGASNFTSSWRVTKSTETGGAIAYNTLISRASLDSSSSDLRSYHLHTLESRNSLRNHVVVFEGGWGRYQENTTSVKQNGGAFFLDARATPKASLPLSFRAYRISPQFVNVTGNFLNSSVFRGVPERGWHWRDRKGTLSVAFGWIGNACEQQTSDRTASEWSSLELSCQCWSRAGV